MFNTYFAASAPKVDAEMLAAALSCYTTVSSYGGSCGTPYGFSSSTYGTMFKTYNSVGNGSAIGLSNNTLYPVYTYLLHTNTAKQNGTFASEAYTFDSIFDGINSDGDIH